MAAAACYFAWGCFRYFGGANFRREVLAWHRQADGLLKTYTRPTSMNVPTLAIRIGPGALPIQNSRNPVLMPARASSFALQRDRAAFPPRPQRRPETGMGEQPVFEPRRRSCEAGGGEDEEWRRRQHRQERADKTEGDEEKAENEIDAAHRPQPASQGKNLQLRPSHGATPRGDQAGCAQHDGHLKKTSTTHDASASAEVVAGPKICLYWPPACGRPACRGAAAGPA